MSLNVIGSLRLDGRISADGLPGISGGAGGGSGGSLRLTVGGLSGTGLLSANGGAGHLPNGGGGGGGRIAVAYQSNAFTGTISARGGAGYVVGGAGSVYLKANSSSVAQVVFDNGGLRGTNTQFVATGTTDLTIRGGAVAASSYSMISLRNLLIGSNSLFSLGYSSYSPESWSVSSNVVIESGGGISADGRGYGANQGTYNGAGRYGRMGGGGGGHGGYGGYGSDGPTLANGGLANTADLARPTVAGSGGGAYTGTGPSGSAGGGALSLTVGGLLHLDGIISANGRSGTTNGAGGGAGGSLLLNVGGLAGSGAISANGGSGDLPAGGGGGGGRVTIYWKSNSYSGSISAKGGAGYTTGGAGTVYLKQGANYTAQVIADNHGLRGTNTLLGPVSLPSDLMVQGSAIVVPSPSSTWMSLTVHSNCAVVMSNQTLSVVGNATLERGAMILADGLGYGPATGPGAGSNFQTPKAGGSHAGLGGFNPGPNSYGTVTAPTSWGSGGANGSGSSSQAPFGGAGGGAVNLNVNGRLTLDGRISASAAAGGLNSGGGAGGSVRLTVGTLSGTGAIAANGGGGNGTAGGGGGGRVAIHFKTNLFAGAVAALGGGGASAGGAGTVFWQETGGTNQWLVVDNGGLSGANLTPLSSLPGNLTLNVLNGAVATPAGTFPLFDSLKLGPGGVLTSTMGQTRLELATLGDLTIEAGGSVSVDGKGFPRSNGDGAGGVLSGQGGGGGYGGAGGASAGGAVGGGTYGSETEPLDRGSGGGAGGSGGSDGGGAMRVNVGGTLHLGGLLSANGNDGWQDDSGGGAGGSIWLTANALTGGGVVSASGGDGELLNGGGGGGGRVALYSPANTFTGLVSVVGGAGANAGQAGTVFVSTNLPGFQVVVHSPSGVVSNVVSSGDLTFTEVVNPGSLLAEDFTLHTPDGPLSPTNLSVTTVGLFTVRVSFPVQNVPGDYRIEVGPDIESLFGQALSQVYTGAFTVALPTLSGSVTNLAGQGVAGVLLQPDGGLPVSRTDATGRYLIGVPPDWTGSVTPGLATNVFVPRVRSYTNVVGNLGNEDYLMVDSITPQLSSGAAGTNVWLGWSGIPGVTYQIHASTNLVEWDAWGEVLAGTNGPMMVVVPASEPPTRFFRLKANN
jgi:hypothetical protein